MLIASYSDVHSFYEYLNVFFPQQPSCFIYVVCPVALMKMLKKNVFIVLSF